MKTAMVWATIVKPDSEEIVVQRTLMNSIPLSGPRPISLGNSNSAVLILSIEEAQAPWCSARYEGQGKVSILSFPVPFTEGGKVAIRQALRKPPSPFLHNPLVIVELVELDELGGIASVWELAVVMRKELFYLTYQCTQEVACAKEQRQFLCDVFARNWPEMFTLLQRSFGECALPKKPVFSGNRMHAKRPADITNGTGCVQWWNDARGCGQLYVPDGIAFLSVNSVVAPPHIFPKFVPGEVVTVGHLDKESRANFFTARQVQKIVKQ